MGAKISRPRLVRRYKDAAAPFVSYRIDDLNNPDWYRENRTKILIAACQAALSESFRTMNSAGILATEGSIITSQQKDAIIAAFHGFHIQFCVHRSFIYFLSKTLPKPPNFHCICAECKTDAVDAAHPVGNVEEVHGDEEWTPFNDVIIHGNAFGNPMEVFQEYGVPVHHP
jgi:hypothetical protein